LLPVACETIYTRPGTNFRPHDIADFGARKRLGLGRNRNRCQLGQYGWISGQIAGSFNSRRALTFGARGADRYRPVFSDLALNLRRIVGVSNAREAKPIHAAQDAGAGNRNFRPIARPLELDRDPPCQSERKRTYPNGPEDAKGFLCDPLNSLTSAGTNQPGFNFRVSPQGCTPLAIRGPVPVSWQ
jgi:hypothetical protein